MSLVAALWPLERVQHLEHGRHVEARPTPNAIASLVAASAVAERKLLASFIACARPGLVAHPTAAIAEAGEHRLDRAHASSVPAYITASVRARAPAAPPDTGAST